MASSIWITRGPHGSSIPVGMCYAVVEPRAEPSPDPRRRPHELAPQRKSVPGQCCAYFWPAISPLDNRRRSGLIELIVSGTRGLVGRVFVCPLLCCGVQLAMLVTRGSSTLPTPQKTREPTRNVREEPEPVGTTKRRSQPVCEENRRRENPAVDSPSHGEFPVTGRR